MPDWMHALKGLTQSVVPQAVTRRAQNAIDDPTAEYDPWEARLRGFTAGALGGAADELSPLGIGSMAMGAGAASQLGRVAPKLGRVINPGLDLIDDIPVRQVQPSMSMVDDALFELKNNLSRLPRGRRSGP